MKKQRKNLLIIIIVLMIATFSYFYIKNNRTDSLKNEKPSLKDDFYEYVNYDLLASKEIPEDRYGWGILTDIQYDIEDEENEMVKEIIQDINNNSNMYIYYHNLLNQDARNESGFEPIKEYMDKIDSANNINELLDTLYELDNEIGLGSVFTVNLQKDYKDKDRNVLVINSIESSCAMFNEISYIEIMETNKQMYKDLLTEYGYDENEASNLVDEYFNLEKNACNGSLSITELQDIDTIYNLYSLDEVKQIYSNIDIEKYLKDYHLDEIDSFWLISEITAKEYNELFVDENLEIFKIKAKINVLLNFYNSLTPSLEKIVTNANNLLTGVDDVKTDEEIAVEFTRVMFADIIEKQFVDKYKDEMEHNIELTKEVIDDIKDEYYNNIKSASWLSDETKQNAIKKLDNLKVNVGYPENFDITSNDYQFASYEDGSNLVENNVNAYQVDHKYQIDKFFNNSDNGTWDFYVDEANAYYKADDNSINVILGILFVLDDSADYYEILGTIGTVVGHEITHAFDFSGSKFDENGNYINWWTDEDLNTFNQKKQEVIEYYKQFKYDGKKLNTELKVGENMADLGSLETILNMLDKKSVTIDEYKKFFESYAYLWASEYTDEYMNNIMLNDEHSPSKIRVNAVLSNLTKFYEIYDIQSGDGMYINPSERIYIWK